MEAIKIELKNHIEYHISNDFENESERIQSWNGSAALSTMNFRYLQNHSYKHHGWTNSKNFMFYFCSSSKNFFLLCSVLSNKNVLWTIQFIPSRTINFYQNMTWTWKQTVLRPPDADANMNFIHNFHPVFWFKILLCSVLQYCSKTHVLCSVLCSFIPDKQGHLNVLKFCQSPVKSTHKRFISIISESATIF